MDKAELGVKLREVRKKKNLTQEELAESVNIGVPYLSEIERGVKMPSLNVFIRIIKALDISADYILRGELPSGKNYALNEITEKLEPLSPEQIKVASDILDGYLKNV